MPRINLLPWREELRQKRKKDFIVAVVVAAALGGALTWASGWVMEQRISNQRARNTTLQNEIKQLDEQIAEISGLQNQKERLLARMRIIEELQQSRPLIVHLFDEIVDAIPEGTHLTGVAQTSQRVELTGVANSTTRVATLMRNIEDSPWLDAPELGSIQATSNDNAARASTFVVRARQDNDEAAEEQP